MIVCEGLAVSGLLADAPDPFPKLSWAWRQLLVRRWRARGASGAATAQQTGAPSHISSRLDPHSSACMQMQEPQGLCHNNLLGSSMRGKSPGVKTADWSAHRYGGGRRPAGQGLLAQHTRSRSQSRGQPRRRQRRPERRGAPSADSQGAGRNGALRPAQP